MKRITKLLISLGLMLSIVFSMSVAAFAALPTDPGLYKKATGITIAKKDGKWRALKNGTFDKTYNGIAKNRYGWWYVRQGLVDFNYTGVAKNEYGWWRVEGGKVNFKFTGVAANTLGTWYIEGGKVDFSKNGAVVIDHDNWYVTGGKATRRFPDKVAQAFLDAGASSASYRKDHKYCIAVNTAQNLVTVYTTDNELRFTKPVRAMVCSCGLSSSPTKLGTYKTQNKYSWRALNGGVYGQYATRITGSYLFHSVPYYSQNKGKLETAEYNKLGSPASAGCVRMAVRDVKWIYNNCPLGTIVYLYSDSDLKEPMLKPSAMKIPSDNPYKGWDPTDPDKNNPWNQ